MSADVLEEPVTSIIRVEESLLMAYMALYPGR
jgi:hypothetical protein